MVDFNEKKILSAMEGVWDVRVDTIDLHPCVTKYSIIRIGKLDSLKQAERWSKILYYEREYPVVCRLMLACNEEFPLNFRDLLCESGYLGQTIYFYGSLFPTHLTKDMIVELERSSEISIRKGAVLLKQGFS